MNCEKCKNKKATVFYADETGGRHSLCASCASNAGKVSQYDPTDDQQIRALPFIPEPTLTTLIAPETTSSIYCSATESELSSTCPYCSTTLDTILSCAHVGCPECYSAFSDLLFPVSLTPEIARGARMPSSRRATIDRIRSINDLRSRIKMAVETENYELAATLRDEIRRLETQKHT